MIAAKLLAASMILAVVVAAAHAQTGSKSRTTVRPSEARTDAPGPYGPRAGSRRTVGPDPFIEGEIMRHRNSGWPD